VRFVLVVLIVVILAIVGLYVYGLTLRPDTRIIEQDAVGAGDV